MPKRFSYNLVGFITALIFYIAIIISLILYLQQKNERSINYTAKKKNILNITLVERKKTKKVIKRKVKKPKKKITKKAKPKKSPKAKPISKTKNVKKVSLQGLFDNIDIKKLPEKKREIVKKSRKKTLVKKPEEIVEERNITKATELVKTLELDEQKIKESSKDGIYDEFRGKVQEIIDKKWQMTIGTISGNEAIVIIYIDKYGNFSYKIVKLSYNDIFNSKLVDFLESMKDEEFPPFKEGEIFKMRVKFKDELE